MAVICSVALPARAQAVASRRVSVRKSSVAVASRASSAFVVGQSSLFQSAAFALNASSPSSSGNFVGSSSSRGGAPTKKQRGFTVVANAAPPAAPTGDVLPPPAVFNAVCGASQKKAALDTSTVILLSMSAGTLIGLGALLMSCVGGASPALAAANPGLSNFLKGAVGLPAGLTLVTLTGAELFTGNVMVMLSGFLAKKIDGAALSRNMVLSFVGNFLGSVLMAYLAFGANTAAAPAMKAAVVGIATVKCALPFSVAFFKGILCNWLVCLAIWGTVSTTSVAGKILAIFWPISMFVALGFEHSVANMFLIPHGMLNGAQVTVSQMMMNNILPVTLGNIVGGAVFTAGLYWYAYGRK